MGIGKCTPEDRNPRVEDESLKSSLANRGYATSTCFGIPVPSLHLLVAGYYLQFPFSILD